MTSTQLQPLSWNTPIVNADGTPTIQFMRFLQDHNLLIGSATDELAVLNAAQIHADAPLDGGGLLKNSPHIGLSNSGVTAGPYGDATHFATFVVDAYGRITSATEYAISASVAVELNGTTVEAATNIFNFTGSNITVTNPTAGTVDIAVTSTPALEVDDAGGTVATAVSKLKFTGTKVTVTNPAAGEALVDIGSEIWAPTVTGVTPGPDLVAGTSGECIMVRIA